MKHLLPPEAWRSEAFAEDLFDDNRTELPSPSPQRGVLLSALLGLLPLLVATAGVAMATWAGA